MHLSAPIPAAGQLQARALAVLLQFALLTCIHFISLQLVWPLFLREQPFISLSWQLIPVFSCALLVLVMKIFKKVQLTVASPCTLVLPGKHQYSLFASSSMFPLLLQLTSYVTVSNTLLKST